MSVLKVNQIRAKLRSLFERYLDLNLAVQVKTGIGRFYADLKKSPYKTIFNPSVSGAKAFNATTMEEVG